MLIVVSGLPGSGKSYFASRLSEKLGAEYVNSDSARKAMEATGRYPFEDELDVYESMAKTAGENLRKGKVVVVDATFYTHEMRDLFFTLSTLLHTPISYIEIEAEEKVIKERLNQSGKRTSAGYAVYQQLKPKYQKLAANHLVLQSTNENIDAMLQEGMDYIIKIKEGKIE
ncbi:MAG: ATP-binding protein [Cyclobacteriaceae bacterium]